MSRPRLGEVLLSLGLVNQAQLRTALAKQRAWNKRLGETLVQMRVITDQQLVTVLAQQLNIPAVDLTDRVIDPRLAEQLGEEFCRRNECIPFAYQDRGHFLDVAMANPLNLELFEQIRVRTRCNPRAYVVGPVTLRNAIISVFGDSGLDPQIPTAEFEDVGIAGERLLELGTSEGLKAIESVASVEIDLDENSNDLRGEMRALRHALAQTNRRIDYLVQLLGQGKERR